MTLFSDDPEEEINFTIPAGLDLYSFTEYYYDSYDFPNFEDWKKEWNLPDDLTEDDLDEDGYYYEGKVDWDFALA